MTQRDTDYWRTRDANDVEMDWPYTDSNWVDGYMHSMEHPHRILIIDALKKVEPWETLLEVGSNVGPNLWKIHGELKDKKLYGIDPNPAVIKYADSVRFMLGGPEIRLGDIASLSDAKCDVVLADAVLMYLGPDEIEEGMDKLARKAVKAIVIVDRFAETTSGEPSGHVWARDYRTLLEARGFKVEETRMRREDWPTSEGWIAKGMVWVGTKI